MPAARRASNGVVAAAVHVQFMSGAENYRDPTVKLESFLEAKK